MFTCRRVISISCVLSLAAVVLVTGCSDDEGKTPKMKKMTGVAKHVDLKNNQVSMAIIDDNGVERELSGSVREDTEVWINGRAHKLEDVREGDTVAVTGFRDKTSSEPKLIATRIDVTRPDASDWKKQDPGTKAPSDDAGDKNVTTASGDKSE